MPWENREKDSPLDDRSIRKDPFNSFVCFFSVKLNKVADLSHTFLETKPPPDDIKQLDLNIDETRVWRLDSGPNLQP